LAHGYTRERAVEVVRARLRERLFEALERERLDGEED
jgi:hypothetical protein